MIGEDRTEMLGDRGLRFDAAAVEPNQTSVLGEQTGVAGGVLVIPRRE